jgi:hypothetical protein
VVALWDGEPGKLGGTADVVDWATGRVPPPAPAGRVTGLTVADRRMVIHLPTPRADRPPAPAVAKVFEDSPATASVFSATELPRLDLAATHTGRRLARIDGFNAEAEDGARDDLLPSELEAHAEPTAGERRLRARYAVANRIAIDAQSRFLAGVRRIYVFGGLSGLSFAVGLHLADFHPAWIATYLLLFAVAFVIHRRTKTLRLEDRQLDHRALAEALRVQYFWRLAGVPDAASDVYLRFHRSALDWVRPAAAAAGIDAEIEPLPPRASPSEARRLKAASGGWIPGQSLFFGKRIVEYLRRHHLAEKWTRGLLIFSVACVALFLLPYCWDRPWCARPPHEAHGRQFPAHLAATLVAAALIVSAVVKLYAEKRAYLPQARRYRRIAEVHDAAWRRLDAPGLPPEERTAVFRDLGRDALVENADWLLLHRDRPVEVPTGG